MPKPTKTPTGPDTTIAVRTMIRAADNPGNQEMLDEFVREVSLILPTPRTLSDEEARELTKMMDISHLFPAQAKNRSKRLRNNGK